MTAVLRITTNAPIRYAKWPAQPTKKVGALLNPGDAPLEIPERDERFYKFVAAEGVDVATVTLTKERVAA